MKRHLLIREQLDERIAKFADIQYYEPPARGWVHAIRQALNMSMRQLGERLSISPQSIKKLEEREVSGSVTLSSLRHVADALDLDLFYGFKPRDGSFDELINRQAMKWATQIIRRSSVQMELEDQKVTDERIAKAIKDQCEELKRETPKFLWDFHPIT